VRGLEVDTEGGSDMELRLGRVTLDVVHLGRMIVSAP